MKHWFKSFAVLTASAILLTGCGGNSEDAAPEAVVEETQAPVATIAFGSPLELGAGLKITLSTPENFTPGKYASNFIKGQVANKFTVTEIEGGLENAEIFKKSLGI